MLDSILITHLNLSSGHILENINIVGTIKVPPHNNKQILLSRPLVNSEVRAIERAQIRNQSNANLSINARVLAGRKQLNLDAISLSINGWISGSGNKS